MKKNSLKNVLILLFNKRFHLKEWMLWLWMEAVLIRLKKLSDP